MLVSIEYRNTNKTKQNIIQFGHSMLSKLYIP